MKRNKHLILIFTVAFMMFTSVWAGAFGAVQPNADPEDVNTDSDVTVMGVEDEGTDVEEITEGSDVVLKAGASDYTFAAPTAARTGSDVTLTWAAPAAKEGAPAVPGEVVYTPKATKDGSSVELEFTVDGLKATAVLEDAGTYVFTVDATFTPAESDEVTVTSEPSSEVKYNPNAPANVVGVKAVSVYKGVAVTWKEDPEATGYIIKRFKGKQSDYNTATTDFVRNTNDSAVQQYITKSNGTITWKNTVLIAKNQVYWYAIYAYKDDPENISEQPAVLYGKGTFVERMVITGTFKQSKSLKSHDKYHKKITFKKGYKMTAQGFSSGEYLFQVKDGNKVYTFWVNRTRIKKPKAIYSKSVSYDAIAEEFINDQKVGSGKNWLIWVSFYTQHVYVFKKGSDKKWKLQKHWECSTGKASTPSPMAINGLKALNNFRPKTRHALKWWNGYSGQNALHGKKKSWKMGKPKSHGCIRNYDWGAKYIYKNCPKGTRVYTW